MGVVVAVLAVAVAAANLVQVYRVGDSGAKAVWGDSARGDRRRARGRRRQLTPVPPPRRGPAGGEMDRGPARRAEGGTG